MNVTSYKNIRVPEDSGNILSEGIMDLAKGMLEKNAL